MMRNREDAKKIINFKWGTVFLCLFFICSLVVGMHRTVCAETIRVGIFNLGRFQYFDEKGMPAGYNVDFLNKIGERTKWDYEFVKCNNWVEATALLKSGRIDLLAPAQHTQELDKEFIYTSYQMGSEFGVIYALADRKALLFEDYATMGTLQYGGVMPSSFTRNFIAYGKEHNFATNLKIYKNTTELFEALNTKQVDAIVTNIMFANDKVKILGRYAPKPVYYITTPDKEQLIKQVDDAMYGIQLNEPTFVLDLVDKYFPQYKKREYSFQQHTMIQSLQPLRVGVFPDKLPASGINAKGELFGYAKEILDNIAKRSGLKFTYVALKSNILDLDEIKAKKLDIVSGLSYDAVPASIKNISLSAPYFVMDKIVVAKGNVELTLDKPTKGAVPKWDDNFASIITQKYPQAMITSCASLEEGLSAVQSGKVDFFIDNRLALERILAKPIYEGLQIIPVRSFTDQQCLGLVTYPENGHMVQGKVGSREMLAILNKSIELIPKEEVNRSVVDATFECKYKTTFNDLLYKFRYAVVLVLVLMAGIIYGLIRWGREKSEGNKALAAKNQALADAVGQADDANRAKSQFLARMSHEIRTPMNAIVGLTAIAHSHLNEPDKMKEYLSKITTSSQVLLNIINDVLDMSAIESSKIKIAQKEFSIKEMMLGISTIYYTQCKDKGIHFILKVEAGKHDLVIGDRLRVNQVMMNLMSNSFKFTDKGGSINITAEEIGVKGDQSFYRFTVSDTGCGMNKDMLSRMFKPFEQQNAVTAQKHGGSGLGLSIAKNLVDLMHGAIKVTSEEGVGTTFNVDLPFNLTKEELEQSADKQSELVVDDESETAEEKVEEEEIPEYDFTGHRLLMAEDIEINAEIAVEIMAMANMKVDVAKNGQEAVDKFSQAPAGSYDLILMDVQMPVLNGYEATKLIRNLPREDAKQIPIFAMTANAFTDDVTASLNAGMNGHISKPIDTQVLYETLAKVCLSK